MCDPIEDTSDPELKRADREKQELEPHSFSHSGSTDAPKFEERDECTKAGNI